MLIWVNLVGLTLSGAGLGYGGGLDWGSAGPTRLRWVRPTVPCGRKKKELVGWADSREEWRYDPGPVLK
jgi:hypothetical protein